MPVMIKLQLPEALKDFGRVQSLPGLADLNLDEGFGLVPLDPRASLYAVRADEVGDLNRRRSLSPEIIEAYGDVRISHFGPTEEPRAAAQDPAPPKSRRASKAPARRR